MKFYGPILMLIFSLGKLSALELEECYRLAQENYPLSKNTPLFQEIAAKQNSALQKNYYPQLQFSAQTSYQSEVSELPLKLPPTIPVTLPEAPDKERYSLQLELRQLLYDGGRISGQERLNQLSQRREEQKNRLELDKLKELICRLYFGILRLEEQEKILQLATKDLQKRVQTLQSQVLHGLALPLQRKLLETELVKLRSRQMELKSQRGSLQEQLSLLLGRTLQEAELQWPQPNTLQSNQRRELEIFSCNRELLEEQQKQRRALLQPTLQIFCQTGYAKPGLNLFQAEADSYWLAGLRLNWELGSFYSWREDEEQLSLQKNLNQEQRESFLLQQSLVLKQKEREAQLLTEQLATDQEQIRLREELLNSAALQLENGTLSAADYLPYLNALLTAKQQLQERQLAILQARAEYNNLLNN